MKIVSFDEFLKMPQGTVFSYYEPTTCRDLVIKGESIYDGEEPIDYFETYLMPYYCSAKDQMEVGIKTRWGEYWYDQMYAVYEEADLAILRKLLG